MICPVRYEPATVIENVRLTPGHHVIELRAGAPLPPIVAGQFANLRCDPGDCYSLLRPFSILDYDTAAGTLSVYYKILGRMSERLSHIPAGESLDCLFPLGGGFPHKPSWQRVALVGGGVGIAPLLLLGRELKQRHPGIIVHGYFGGRSAPDLVPDLLGRYDFEMRLATDDGSLGYRGNAVRLFTDAAEPYDAIYTCGPNPMMHALKDVLPADGAAFASLEEYMACATGACYGCTALLVEPDGTERRLRVCRDGPIFDLRQVVFET
jgi:dihydroorotate dehydrogenase electron transfer subunit